MADANLNALLADWREEQMADMQYEIRHRSIRKHGLTRLVYEAASGQSWLPHNLASTGPARGRSDNFLPKEGEEGLVRVYARMAGFVRKIGQDPNLVRAYSKIVSPNGQNSPYTYVDLWQVHKVWGSPEAFLRHVAAVRLRAEQILSGWGIKPHSGRTAAAALRFRAVGKAAVAAAAATLLRWNFQRYSVAREHLAAVFSGRMEASEGAEYLRRVHGVSKIMGVSHDLARELEVSEAETLKPFRGKFLRQWGALAPQSQEERPHAFRALANIYLAFGEKDALAVLGRVRAGQVSLHDAGINLAGLPLVKEATDWLFRQDATRWQDACRVAQSWTSLRSNGWDPKAKGSLNVALTILASQCYEGARSIEFANEAARWAVPADDYSSWEERWLAGYKPATCIPAPGGLAGLTDGECRLVQLAHDDPRALFAGAHTGCCQHPGSVGSSCAWHAHESENGAIWAIERRGRIIAQSWVWRTAETMVLDNIEAGGIGGNEELLACAKRLFIAAAKSAVGRLGLSQVFCGTGYSGLTMDGPVTPCPVWAPASYTDAHNVWQLA